MQPAVSIEHIVTGRRLGKAPATSHPNMLMFSNYTPKKAEPVPPVFKYWQRKKPIVIRDLGNNEYGNCTIASQVVFVNKMERQEQRRNVLISKEETIRVYLAMSDRLYGGGDNGAYERDALNNWRNPDFTFRDAKGRPYTISAYTRVNHASVDEVKRAIVTSGGHGVKVCFQLPIAWANTFVWDLPVGQRPIGQYQPNSWGGHSMVAALDYDQDWLYLDHTWNCETGRVSWRAFATYADEAYMVVDDVNQWKKRVETKTFNINALVSDVNSISDVKIR